MPFLISYSKSFVLGRKIDTVRPEVLGRQLYKETGGKGIAILCKSKKFSMMTL